MHGLVIFLSFIGVCSTSTIQSQINEWCSKFVTLQSFATCEHKQELPCSGRTAQTIIPGLNTSDFELYGHVHGQWQQMFNPDINAQTCFKGRCSKNIRFITGNINSEGLQKSAEVTFHDGSKIIAFFVNSIVHGLAVDFDPSGHQKRIGFYHNGQDSFPFWHFSPSTNSAVFYWNAEEALYLVGEGCFAVNLISNRITSGTKCQTSEFVTENEFLVPKIMSLNSSLIPEFQAPDYLISLSDFVIVQSTWLSLLDHQPIQGQSIFRDPSRSITDLVDPSAIPKNFEDGSITKCNGVVTAHLLLKGSLQETPFVCALGSGSKWIGNLLEWSTGIQGYVDAVAGKYPSLLLTEVEKKTRVLYSTHDQLHDLKFFGPILFQPLNCKDSRAFLSKQSCPAIESNSRVLLCVLVNPEKMILVM